MNLARAGQDHSLGAAETRGFEYIMQPDDVARKQLGQEIVIIRHRCQVDHRPHASRRLAQGGGISEVAHDEVVSAGRRNEVESTDAPACPCQTPDRGAPNATRGAGHQDRD